MINIQDILNEYSNTIDYYNNFNLNNTYINNNLSHNYKSYYFDLNNLKYNLCDLNKNFFEQIIVKKSDLLYKKNIELYTTTKTKETISYNICDAIMYNDMSYYYFNTTVLMSKEMFKLLNDNNHIYTNNDISYLKEFKIKVVSGLNYSDVIITKPLLLLTSDTKFDIYFDEAISVKLNLDFYTKTEKRKIKIRKVI